MKGLEFRYFLWFLIKTEGIEEGIRSVFMWAHNLANEIFGSRIVRRVGPEDQNEERHEFESLKAKYMHLGGGF